MSGISTAPPSFLTSFSRAQIASLIATGLDYGILFLLTEAFGVWYVTATAIGAIVGAVTHFLLNRHWSFEAWHGSLKKQAIRYSLVSFGSLILNTGGVFLITEYLKLHYAVSVTAVSIVVGVAFNYPLHRHFVYRPEN